MIKTLILKDIKKFLFGPFYYVLMAFYVIIISLIFFNNLVALKGTPQEHFVENLFKPLFGTGNFILMFISPFCLMSSLSSEENQGTHYNILLSKLKYSHILTAKFFSHSLLLIIMSTIYLIIAFILSCFSLQNWSLFFSCYLGTFLNIFIFTALGLMSSALSKKQFVASLLNFLLIFLLYLLPFTAYNVQNPMITEILFYMGPSEHFISFTAEFIKSYNLVYYISFIFFFFFLSHAILKIRWIYRRPVCR